MEHKLKITDVCVVCEICGLAGGDGSEIVGKPCIPKHPSIELLEKRIRAIEENQRLMNHQPIYQTPSRPPCGEVIAHHHHGLICCYTNPCVWC